MFILSRPTLCAAAAWLLLSGTSIAANQPQDCPPGDWFCESVPPPSPPGPEVPGSPEPLEPPSAKPVPEPSYPRMNLSIPPPPPLERRARPKTWAVRTQLLVPFVDSGAASNYSMGGLGFGVRARPDLAVAIDLTFDALGGVDYAGHDRTEMALDLATTVFFNPHDPVQGFILAGLGWSRADVSYSALVKSATGTLSRQIDQTYYYFGLFAGLGLEWRFEPRWSLDIALLGIARGRTDSAADNNPEFVDPKTHLATNSSGFGLFRLGLNYYF